MTVAHGSLVRRDGGQSRPRMRTAPYTRGSGLRREFIAGSWRHRYVRLDLRPSGPLDEPGALHRTAVKAPFNDAAFFISNVGTQELLSTVFHGWRQHRDRSTPGTFTATRRRHLLARRRHLRPDRRVRVGRLYLTVDNFNIHQSTGETGPPTPVPEPGTLLMLMGGFAAVLTARRYRVKLRIGRAASLRRRRSWQAAW